MDVSLEKEMQDGKWYQVLFSEVTNRDDPCICHEHHCLMSKKIQETEARSYKSLKVTEMLSSVLHGWFWDQLQAFKERCHTNTIGGHLSMNCRRWQKNQVNCICNLKTVHWQNICFKVNALLCPFETFKCVLTSISPCSVKDAVDISLKKTELICKKDAFTDLYNCFSSV